MEFLRNKGLITSFLLLYFVVGMFLAHAVISVGVKGGDWIEYSVVTTGKPEEGHDVVWARMEILEVRGTQISVNVTTKASNGTFEFGVMILNPAKGDVGVWFIIPANLSVGESFYDASKNQNVTIEGSKQRSIAGATRTVTHATTPERIKSWDKNTGVFVESIDVLSNYTLNATAYATNMWNAQILGVEPPIFYVSVIGVFIAVFASATVIIRQKNKNKESLK